MDDARANQKRRTRKDLLLAAGRLLREGRDPSLEEVAEAALVSRATAYRYFPGVEALLLEASLDLALPEPQALFAGAPDDPLARVERLHEVFHGMLLANEKPLRMMLLNSLRQAGAEGQGAPVRQNRRSALIEAALEPAREQFAPGALDTLGKALAMLLGIEGLVVQKDVLQLDDAEAERVTRWALRALVQAARRE
ncbi:TetR/AcrR family transcriptional regulator [Pseudomonas citronellolis]|uniref:TetR/AcrR family transcriptional regulator n=1 Tax=Pseudomonas citronellolis TaxID=53408 RepID=UPI0023E3CC70|nr:TetR/AcrR family transcriptional regulator [Pseudomonas citronellolis]MDF3935584.1 TetR family transcriptional regulator [Pseudomonas citronellolis]